MKTLRALKSLKKYYHKDRKNIFILTILLLLRSFVSLVFAATWGLILNSLMQAKFFEAVAFEEHGVGEMNNRIHGDTQEIVNLFSHFVSMIGNFIAVFVIIIIFIKINIILSIEVILFAIVIF